MSEPVHLSQQSTWRLASTEEQAALRIAALIPQTLPSPLHTVLSQ